MFSINLHTALNSCRAVVPHLLRQGGGRIVNVAARAALAGVPTLAAYCASKSALVRLSESLAAELKDQGITVNCVLPGTIDTPQNRRDMPGADFSKWVAPEAIADVILFLASDAARAVSGASIPVYGRS
jgi:NAD(P)-dependent dehydrogenase (short-subunit alcohol dehydrogenase family)